MSTLKTTNLQHASAASPAIVLASDGTATAQLSSLNGGALSGARNRIINGDMRIDQRNAGASVTLTSDGTYTLDRWKAWLTASSKYSIQQNAGSVTPPAGFSNYLGVTSLAATTVASGDYYVISQSIEGFNSADFGFGTANARTVTLSFWVRSSLTGTFGGSLRNDAASRSYPFTYSISAANTWEYKTITVAGDTTGTWVGSTNAGGILIWFSLGVGSTYSGTAGAWAAGNYTSATGATSVVGTNGATFYITGVQLEPGSVATPFERRSYGQELALCQRYYQTVADTAACGTAVSTTACLLKYTYPVTMRAVPTRTLETGSTITIDFFGSGQSTSTAVTFTGSEQWLGVNVNTLSPARTAFVPVSIIGIVFASAEL